MHQGSDGRSSLNSKKENIMSKSNNKKPSHFVYTVREGNENNSDFWTKIGAAFSHNDGKGFSVIMDALPLDGKITIRKAEPKK